MNDFLRKAEELFHPLINIIYPYDNLCIFCERYFDDLNNTKICDACSEKYFNEAALKCEICGRISNSRICKNCFGREFYFKQGAGVFDYKDNVADVIKKFKFFNQKALKECLGNLMYKEILSKSWEIDYIIPVPLHEKRQKFRGYNQSELLAQEISTKTGIPIKDDMLLRIANTKTQSKLNHNQRVKNIKDAFSLAGSVSVKGLSVLLVDDVFTTGATINECAKTLVKNGAKQVWFAVLAFA